MLEEVKSKGNVVLKGLEVPADTRPVPTAAELMVRTNQIGELLRVLILDTKRLPKAPGVDPHLDAGRSLALSQAHLQTGFMWLRRAIEVPKVF